MWTPLIAAEVARKAKRSHPESSDRINYHLHAASLLPSRSGARANHLLQAQRIVESPFLRRLYNNAAKDPPPAAVALPPTQDPYESIKAKLSDQKFADLGRINEGDSPNKILVSQETIKAIPYEYMFKSQVQCIPDAMLGKDIFVKAKTGHGKTLGFLIPAIENLRRSPAGFDRNFGIIIVAPTHKVARQILEDNVRPLLRFHERTLTKEGGAVKPDKPLLAPDMYAVAKGAIGDKPTTPQMLLKDGADVLVATPATLSRLIAESQELRERMCKGVRVLILDEADELLDSGFYDELTCLSKTIQSCQQCKKNDRRKKPEDATEKKLDKNERTFQTMLFSATTEGQAKKEVSFREFLKSSFLFVDTTLDDDTDANTSIVHEYFDMGQPKLLGLCLYKVLLEKSKAFHKIVVFFPSNSLVEFAEKFYTLTGIKNIVCVHGKMQPNEKARSLLKFEDNTPGKSAIMFCSDALARGFDTYVTLVVQFGCTDQSKYQHRAGRSGRRNDMGYSLTLLGADENKTYINDINQMLKTRPLLRARDKLLHKLASLAACVVEAAGTAKKDVTTAAADPMPITPSFSEIKASLAGTAVGGSSDADVKSICAYVEKVLPGLLDGHIEAHLRKLGKKKDVAHLKEVALLHADVVKAVETVKLLQTSTDTITRSTPDSRICGPVIAECLNRLKFEQIESDLNKPGLSELDRKTLEKSRLDLSKLPRMEAPPEFDKAIATVDSDTGLNKSRSVAYKSTYGAYKSLRIWKDAELWEAMRQRFIGFGYANPPKIELKK